MTSDVTGPFGQPLRAAWGSVDDGATAVIEITRASGLALVPPAERNPMTATSFGAGQLIAAALAAGCRRILVGLGGSATVDGGAGLVTALGARLLDARGASIDRGGAGLAALERIDVSALDERLAGVELVAACDVDNELVGPTGAARTFAPQKGATPEMVADLEQNLSHWADVIERDLGRDVRHARHGGAAGGIGAAILGILGGTLAPGGDLVLDWLSFDERLAGCDLVMTAEGFVDISTLANKAPVAVARAARRRGVPVVLVAGGMSDDVTSAT